MDGVFPFFTTAGFPPRSLSIVYFGGDIGRRGKRLVMFIAGMADPLSHPCLIEFMLTYIFREVNSPMREKDDARTRGSRPAEQINFLFFYVIEGMGRRTS